jgi:hypothetical protein
MLRVTLRGGGLPTVVLGTGESLWFGRSPHAGLEDLAPEAQLRATALTLPRVAQHVSRTLGVLEVGDEIVRLRWQGGRILLQAARDGLEQAGRGVGAAEGARVLGAHPPQVGQSRVIGGVVSGEGRTSVQQCEERRPQ